MAREHTAPAFARIVGLIDSQDERVALAAAVEVINRGWGKPLVQTQSDVRKVDFGALYLEGMKLANQAAKQSDIAKVIEASITEETEDTEAAASEQVIQDGAAAPPEW
jgi:hypothetical protein